MKAVSPWAPAVIFFVCLASAAAEDKQASGRSLGCNPDFEPATPSYGFVEEERRKNFDIPENAKVGEIHYTRLPIFDESNPEEDNFLYRWANRFHIMTREEVITRQVLFNSGDDYEQRLVDETARVLRRREYLYDVDVRPVSQCDDKVDVEVITKDVWSFTPEISFDRSGGENTYRFGIQESNLFGFGKQIAITRDKDNERDSNEVIYKDDNVLGSWIQTRIAFVNSDDGSNQFFNLSRPFFSLDTRRSWAIRLENIERDDTQYFRGDDATEVRHEIEDYIVQYGFSKGLQNDRARRWIVGYRYRDDRFFPGDEFPPPSPFPRDKEMSYPFLAYQEVEDDYTTAFNLDQIHRTEDLHLGHTLFARVGYAATGLGSSQDRLVFEGVFNDTLIYNEDILLRHELEWESLWNLDTHASEDVLISWGARYFKRQTSHRSFFAKLEGVWSHNLNTNQQVVLGGDNGVRGFENRFQVGDRRVVFSMEERMYTDIHLFNLIRLGWALFVDVGRAWEPGEDDGIDEDILANAGFGLRLASSKAEAGRIAHLDFAFPLTNRDDPEVDTVLIAFNVKSVF